VAALLLLHLGDGEVSMGLPGQVPGLAVQVYGVPQLGVCVVEAARQSVGTGEVAVGEGLRRHVV
jgi:hypothetical protein